MIDTACPFCVEKDAEIVRLKDEIRWLHQDLDEEKAFIILWHHVMHNMVNAARVHDRHRRNVFQNLLDWMIDAYPAYARKAMDPKEVQRGNEIKK